LYILEVVTPGTWLVLPDKEKTRQIERLVDLLKMKFLAANTALILFEHYNSLREYRREQRKTDRVIAPERHERMRQQVEIEFGARGESIDWSGISKEVDRRLRIEDRANGKLPVEMETNLPHIYAREFLYSLSVFAKCLRALAQEPDMPAALSDAVIEMDKAVPDLNGVRDTTQHLEDRVRSLDRKGQPLKIKPTATEPFAGAANLLLLDVLSNSRYCSTKENGEVGAVDVSRETLRSVHNVLTQVIQAFMWEGPPQEEPR
jgi:hypothetical protein